MLTCHHGLQAPAEGFHTPDLTHSRLYLSQYLPKIKELPKAKVTRQVCGGCMDFKVSIAQPLEEHGSWAKTDYEPLESEFMAKLKAIKGTSMHETQEITFEPM